MKKILTLVCAAMMVAAVEAKVIMTESFDRTVGTLNMGRNTSMGNNTADWWTYSGGTGSEPKYIQVAAGTLSYPGYSAYGKGKKAHICSSDADDFRKFANEYTSGKVYMAAIINVEELRQGTNADYFLSFGDGSVSKFYGRLWTRSVKDDASSKFVGFQLGIGKFTENEKTVVPYTSEVLEIQKDYLVVLEYEFVDGTKNDKVSLYINPTQTTTQPTLVCKQDTLNDGGTQIGSNAKEDASKIAAVYLRQGTNTPRQVYVDEIRVATTWDELFIDDSEEPGGEEEQEEDDALVIETDDNLLQNSSFEEHTCDALFGCSFEDWSLPLNTSSANLTDKLLGDAAILVNPTMNVALDQGVLLNDATYAEGTLFTLTINYKVLEMPAGESLKLDCYWEAAAGGDAEAIKAHDADILQVELESAKAWKHKVVTSSKPARSSYLRVRVSIPKGAKVLFDAWCLVEGGEAPEAPFITVSPTLVTPVTTTIGNTVNFQTIHIKHGNVTGATTFYIGGKDAGQFQQSAYELPADQSELDLIITYAPASTGSHEASLIFDNVNHTTILPNLISLRGSCTDPSAKPEITVTPSELNFEVVAGNRQEKKLTVSSVNCTDFVYARVDHILGTAFTIDGTMAGKNYDTTVTVTFAPRTAGTFQSTVTFYTQGGENVVVTLNGVGLAPTPETVDWQTDFSWDESHPLAYMFEPFDNAEHNKTLLVDGWQNVASAEARPWWGFDESKTSPVRGEEKYAKATAYKWGAESTGDWSMWLVTPALDYKNAETKVFAFKVMGEYLSDEQKAALEIYYVDPAQATDDLRFLDLTEDFSIPKTGDESGQWVSFNLDLEPLAATVADVFHMAFRYVGPNGDAGAVTYYIDDVSWGKEQPMGIESVQSSDVSSQKILRNGQLLILRADHQFNILGIRVK